MKPGEQKDLNYIRPKFLEELHTIREAMSRDCDYDVDLFAEMIRSGKCPRYGPAHNIRGVKQNGPVADDENERNPQVRKDE